jgi:hypothetical protein
MGIVSPFWVDRHRVQHVCPDLEEQLMLEWLVAGGWWLVAGEMC